MHGDGEVKRQGITSNPLVFHRPGESDGPDKWADRCRGWVSLFLPQSVSNNSFPVEMTKINIYEAKTQTDKRDIPLALYNLYCADTIFVN